MDGSSNNLLAPSSRKKGGTLGDILLRMKLCDLACVPYNIWPVQSCSFGGGGRLVPRRPAWSPFFFIVSCFRLSYFLRLHSQWRRDLVEIEVKVSNLKKSWSRRLRQLFLQIKHVRYTMQPHIVFPFFLTLTVVGGHGLSDEITEYSHACTERMQKLWPGSFIDIFLNPFLCS